jgi:hypothetical protein
MVNELPDRTALGRAPSRTGERGAAMFIVLLVVMILSAIGTFALSNARFEVQSSGFLRQRSVSMETTAFGAAAAMAEISSAPAAYLNRMKAAGTTGEVCKANAGLATSPAPPCFRLYLLDIENRTGTTTSRLYQPAASGNPGSLGLDRITGGFTVELTEPLDVIRPVPGAPIDGSPGTPKFLDITLSSTGVVFVDSNANYRIDWATGPGVENEGLSAVFTSGRGHLVLGPIYGAI